MEKPSQANMKPCREEREREMDVLCMCMCVRVCVRANGSRRSGPMRCGAADTRAEEELGKRMEARFGSPG